MERHASRDQAQARAVEFVQKLDASQLIEIEWLRGLVSAADQSRRQRPVRDWDTVSHHRKLVRIALHGLLPLLVEKGATAGVISKLTGLEASAVSHQMKKYQQSSETGEGGATRQK